MATEAVMELMTIQTVTVTNEFKDFDKPLELPVESLNTDSIDIGKSTQANQPATRNSDPEQAQLRSKALTEMLQKKKEIISIFEEKEP